jgi:hypothetical protein
LKRAATWEPNRSAADAGSEDTVDAITLESAIVLSPSPLVRQAGATSAVARTSFPIKPTLRAGDTGKEKGLCKSAANRQAVTAYT